MFVGSFNFDPRSMALDTEMVFAVQSPRLAAQFLDAMAVDMAPENAWRIVQVDGGRAVGWLTADPVRPVVEAHDPASTWRRFLKSIQGLLPIAYLL